MLSSSALRRHPASLLPRIVHNPSLTDLIRYPVTRDMVAYIAKQATNVIQCALMHATVRVCSDPKIFQVLRRLL